MVGSFLESFLSLPISIHLSIQLRLDELMSQNGLELQNVVYSLLGPRGCDGISLDELAETMGFENRPISALAEVRRVIEDRSDPNICHCLLVCRTFVPGNPIDLMVDFHVRQIYLPMILLRPREEQEDLPFVHLTQLSPPIDKAELAASLRRMLDMSREYNQMAERTGLMAHRNR